MVATRLPTTYAYKIISCTLFFFKKKVVYDPLLCVLKMTRSSIISQIFFWVRAILSLFLACGVFFHPDAYPSWVSCDRLPKHTLYLESCVGATVCLICISVFSSGPCMGSLYICGHLNYTFSTIAYAPRSISCFLVSSQLGGTRVTRQTLLYSLAKRKSYELVFQEFKKFSCTPHRNTSLFRVHPPDLVVFDRMREMRF